MTTTTREDGLTIVTHETDFMVSVYRGTPHIGIILPAISGKGFDARPSAPNCHHMPDAHFASLEDAIDYLARA